MHTPQCVQALCRCEIAIDFDAVILQPGAWLRSSARGLTDTRHLAPRRDREHHILERDEWLEDFCQSAGASDEPLGKFCAVHARIDAGNSLVSALQEAMVKPHRKLRRDGVVCVWCRAQSRGG